MKSIFFLAAVFIVSGCVDNSNAARGYRDLKSQNYGGAVNRLKLSVAENADSQLSIVNLAWAYQNIGDYSKSLKLYLHVLNSMKNCKLPNPEKATYKNKPISDLITANLSVMKSKLSDKSDINEINRATSNDTVRMDHMKKCK